MRSDPVLIDFFLEMMSGERGAAANTIQSYRRDLDDASRFVNRISSVNLRSSLAEATSEVLEKYLQSLHAAGMARSTQARKLSALKQFYRFLNTEDMRKDNPTARLEGVRPQRALPKTLNQSHVQDLMNKAHREAEATRSDESPENARRDRALLAWRLYALLEILYATGLRVTELVSLPLAAVTSTGPFVLVRGKGNKERLVPLTPQARKALDQYLSELKHYAGAKGRDDSAFCFPANSREGHLTRQAFARDLKALGARAGLQVDLSPHILRHAFATHLLQNGADLRVLQTLLGHSDVSTTQIYTHIQTGHLKRAVELHHPLSDQFEPID